MSVWGKARRRREIFEDLVLKIIVFMKKIEEKRPLKTQNFLGAFGADHSYSTDPNIRLKFFQTHQNLLNFFPSGHTPTPPVKDLLDPLVSGIKKI